MKTRIDVLRFIIYHITNGKGITLQLDGSDIRLEMPKNKPYVICHDETFGRIAAVIYPIEDSRMDFVSEWASQNVEFYDL